MTNFLELPAFCDVHVHFREPGFSHKETIATGCAAAAHGGYADVCTMPNTNPVIDSLVHLKQVINIIQEQSGSGAGASVRVHPYASITVEQRGKELVDMEALTPYAVAFSDDGHGIQEASVMEQAMNRAHALNKLIVAHCEVNDLLHGGYIHDGVYARAHGHKGICSESEWRQIERDCDLAAKTGCGYHVCHISTEQSVEIIRQAKASGVDVTCEVTPHHILLDESHLQEDGRFKMNPPLRTLEDREAILTGLVDGTIDMVATDHAPHSAEEKSRGLAHSPFGIVGLETAFPLLYTYLVREGIISLDRLVELMAFNPRKRFGLGFSNVGVENSSSIANNNTGDMCIWDIDSSYEINPETFLSKGKSTSFEGWRVFGRCVKTVIGGKVAYEAN